MRRIGVEPKEVHETLCMRVSPCKFDGSYVEPFWIWDSELVVRGTPFSAPSACLLKALDCRVGQLCCGVISWETSACFGCLANNTVQAFFRICGVDEFAHRQREGKKWDHLLPRRRQEGAIDEYF